MDAQVEGKQVRKARGDRNSGSQEAVVSLDPVRASIVTLEQLHRSQQDAAMDYSEAIKATAEAAGISSSVLSRYVKARCSDRFAAKVRETQQLSLLFENA